MTDLEALLRQHRPRARAAAIEEVTDQLLHSGNEALHEKFTELCELAVRAFDNHQHPVELSAAEILATPSTVPLMRYFLEALNRYRDDHHGDMKAAARLTLLGQAFGLSAKGSYVRSTRSQGAKTAYKATGINALRIAFEKGLTDSAAIRAALAAMNAEHKRLGGSTGGDSRTAARLKKGLMEGLLSEALQELPAGSEEAR